MPYGKLCLFAIFALFAITQIGAASQLRRSATESTEAAQSNLTLDSKSDDIRSAVELLSSGESEQIEKARIVLLRHAKKSSAERNDVINALMERMDNPEIDFEKDIATYYVWREGSLLLGELRATQALDLLVSHLDLSNGFHSASMIFQPAILGICRFGSVAIPKLSVALLQSPNRNIRIAAAYCLTEIGGSAAADVLRQALGSETNKCVTRFMAISIDTFSYKSKSGRILFDVHAPRATTNARRRWLNAFQCVD